MLDKVTPSLAWPVYIAGVDHRPGGGQVRYREVKSLGELGAPAVAHWLARAAIYALPARYEPFGLSIPEAGLAGCALVLGDIPSLREVWDDGAIFVPSDDADALAMTLQALTQDPAWQVDLAARARALQFTPQRMLAGYLTVYKELLSARHKRGRRQGA